MKATDSLFKLIKSMTGPEKGYFKKFSSLHAIGGTNNYLKLFEAIDRSSEYNERSIKKQFTKHSFVRNFANEKRYLYLLILKAFRNYHAGISPDEEIHERIDYARTLERKRMLKEALSMLAQAKKLAYDHERYPWIIIICRKERNIISFQQSLSSIKRNIELINEEKRMTRILQSFADYRDAHVKLFTFYTEKGYARTKEDVEYLKKTIDIPFMHEKDPLLLKSIYELKNICCDFCGDFAAAYVHVSKIAEIEEKKLHKVGYNNEVAIQNYAARLCNMIGCLLILKRNHEAMTLVGKLKALQRLPYVAKSEHLQAILFSYVAAELGIYIGLGDFKKGLEVVDSVITGLEKHKGKIGSINEQDLAFMIAGIYFGAGKYNEALKWINDILNFSKKETRRDFRSLAMLIHLILHIELGHDDLISALVRSVYRHMLKRENLYKLENTILEFIKKKFLSPNPLPELFKNDIRKKLYLLAEDPFVKHALTYFDFISWVESKMLNKSIAEIVQSKGRAH